MDVQFSILSGDVYFPPLALVHTNINIFQGVETRISSLHKGHMTKVLILNTFCLCKKCCCNKNFTCYSCAVPRGHGSAGEFQTLERLHPPHFKLQSLKWKQRWKKVARVKVKTHLNVLNRGPLALTSSTQRNAHSLFVLIDTGRWMREYEWKYKPSWIMWKSDKQRDSYSRGALLTWMAAACSWINACDGSLKNRNRLICPVGVLCKSFPSRPIEVEWGEKAQGSVSFELFIWNRRPKCSSYTAAVWR